MTIKDSAPLVLKRILIKANRDPNSEENKAYLERKRNTFTAKAEHQTYIIYEFESDLHTLTHKPNRVDADSLTIGDTHDYNDCKSNTFTYSGYESVDKFCNWLFTDVHSHSTAIAHNQAGYDGRFSLQCCLNKGLHPSKFIKQGSKIMYMEFLMFHISFADSLQGARV